MYKIQIVGHTFNFQFYLLRSDHSGEKELIVDTPNYLWNWYTYLGKMNLRGIKFNLCFVIYYITHYKYFIASIQTAADW